MFMESSLQFFVPVVCEGVSVSRKIAMLKTEQFLVLIISKLPRDSTLANMEDDKEPTITSEPIVTSDPTITTSAIPLGTTDTVGKVSEADKKKFDPAKKVPLAVGETKLYCHVCKYGRVRRVL